MSYILDALRKADAQRERDAARGIHAQALQGSAAAPSGGVPGRRALWSGGALVLAAAIAATWWVAGRGAGAVAPRSESLALVQQPVAPAAAQVLPAPVAAPVVPAAQVQTPAPLALAASRPEPAPLIMAPAYTGQPPGMTPSHGPSSPPALQAQGFPNRALAPPTAPSTALPVAPPPLPPVQGLPPDAPKLVINGGVYSSNPAQRMLIVNGQVVKEGADLGSGVKLEQITAKSAVLAFRGARYTVGY